MISGAYLKLTPGDSKSSLGKWQVGEAEDLEFVPTRVEFKFFKCLIYFCNLDIFL